MSNMAAFATAYVSLLELARSTNFEKGGARGLTLFDALPGTTARPVSFIAETKPTTYTVAKARCQPLRM